MGYFIGIGDRQKYVEDGISLEEATKEFMEELEPLTPLPPLPPPVRLSDDLGREELEGVSQWVLREKYRHLWKPFLKKKDFVEQILKERQSGNTDGPNGNEHSDGGIEPVRDLQPDGGGDNESDELRLGTGQVADLAVGKQMETID